MTPEERVAALEEAVREYADHQSWRCAHPPHFYLAETPPDLLAGEDCACGLTGTLKKLRLEE